MFGRGWEPSTATIVMRHAKGGGLGTGRPTVYEFLADVQPPGGGPVFRTVIQEPGMHPSFVAPGEGEVVKVFVNKKQEVKFDADDPARSYKSAEQNEAAQWEAAKQTAPGSQPVGSGAGSRGNAHRTALFIEAIANAKGAGDAAYEKQLQDAFKAGDSTPPPKA